MAGAETGNFSGGEDEDFCDPAEPDDEDFHKKFMTEMRQKE
jgi:hypothetical protein